MTEFEYKSAPKSAPLRTDQRYRHTKTGLVGCQRDTMLQNELHHLVIFNQFAIFIRNFRVNNVNSMWNLKAAIGKKPIERT